jgi:2-keto-3-deoxy-L-rhamnonate aldolase RhmA
MNDRQQKYLWQQIPNTTITEILCTNNGFDGVVLDNEHGVYSNENLFQCIQTASLCSKKVFVRLTEPDKTLVRLCLDSGVDGLVFSTIENEDQVKNILDQCLFPDQGGRRGYGLTRDSFWGERSRKKDIRLVAQIETVEGVDWLSGKPCGMSIFDYFLIGPYDLSCSLGEPENFESKAFKSCIKKVENAVGKCKMGYHIVKDIKEYHNKLKDCGFLAYSLDTLMLIDSIKNMEESING